MYILEISDDLIDAAFPDAPFRVRPPLDPEIERWCQDNMRFDYQVQSEWPKRYDHKIHDRNRAMLPGALLMKAKENGHKYVIRFFSDNDALHFKMRWL